MMNDTWPPSSAAASLAKTCTWPSVPSFAGTTTARSIAPVQARPRTMSPMPRTSALTVSSVRRGWRNRLRTARTSSSGTLEMYIDGARRAPSTTISGEHGMSGPRRELNAEEHFDAARARRRPDRRRLRGRPGGAEPGPRGDERAARAERRRHRAGPRLRDVRRSQDLAQVRVRGADVLLL